MNSSTITLPNVTGMKSEQIMTPRIEKQSSLLVSSLWFLSSLFSAAKIGFIANTSGIFVTFNLQDVALIVITAWMVHKGLKTRNVPLIIPWLLTTTYLLYYNHYKNLMRMTRVLRNVRHATALPWIAIAASTFGLVLKMILILRILQVSANLWYRRKLEKELYQQSQ